MDTEFYSLVSIVIPTHDRPTALVKAIMSALGQTYSHIEIIIVIDGPDSQTQRAISELRDKRIRVISVPATVGGSEARNIGVRSSNGRWVALLDDDDEWLPNKLEQQVSLALACGLPENYVIASQYVIVKGGVQSGIWPDHFPSPGQPLSEFLFSSRGGFQTSVYFAPKLIFLEFPFTSGLKKHQDLDWILRIASDDRKRILWVPQPLAIYNAPVKGSANVSTNLDWTFSLRWANDRRHLLTRQSYSQFVARLCAQDAAAQNAALADRFRLLKAFVLCGRPTLRSSIEFMCNISLTSAFREKCLNVIDRLRS